MKRLLIILIAITSFSQMVYAYDFSAVAPTGQTLYYNIRSGGVEVTCPNYTNTIDDPWSSYSKPTGNLTIPDSVVYGDSAYSVIRIGYSAFERCNGLTSVTIPNSVTEIGVDAFKSCYGLTSVTIPNSVTMIKSYAFCCCDSLTSVTIPNSVTQIQNHAFCHCGGLTSVILPNSITTIGNYAFYNCHSLNTVTIPNSVTTIGECAFARCSVLTAITIPNSVTNIGEGAFSGCRSLTTVTIPDSVRTIEECAFLGCYSLTTVNFNATRCGSAGANRDYDYRAFRDCYNITTVNIGNNVTCIPSYLFYDCDSITSVTIPNSVSSIGDYAFSGCSGLITLNFNAERCNTNYSAFTAFNGCHKISTVNFGDSVTIIPPNLCQGFREMTTVSIPSSVIAIGNNAFEGCSSLTTLNFNAEKCTYAGDSVNGAGLHTCSNLVTLNFGGNVTRIPPNLFSDCIELTTLSIPNSVERIGKNAFCRCDHITNITLGGGLTAIEDGAFRGCTQVLRMTSKSIYPPTAYINTFNGLSDGVVLNVPCGAAHAYENSAYWFRFNIQEDLIFDFSATSSNPARGTVTIVTMPTCDNMEAQVQANAYHGYHFDHWSDGNTDNPRYIVVLQDTHLVAYFASDNGEDEGIDETLEESVKLYQRNGQIVVEGAEGYPVYLYDVVGRLLATKRETAQEVLLDVPASSAYLVKIGDAPARRIVVRR